MESLRALLGIELPIVQAPMAGVQRSALGSLPCAMLGPDAGLQPAGNH